jgi:hypothetical protein
MMMMMPLQLLAEDDNEDAISAFMLKMLMLILW